jgi:AraC family transcriptional regulator, positive regulator of tynA and feaB
MNLTPGLPLRVTYMRTLFSGVGRHSDAWRCWAEMARREFFDGDLEADQSEEPAFTFGKALEFPVSLIHFTAHVSMGYRRSWQQIRHNRVGSRLIWVVRRGAVDTVSSAGPFAIKAGEAGIINSNMPFHQRISCDADSVFESFLVTVPAQLFLTHLPEAESFNGRFSLNTSDGNIAHGLLDLMAGEGERLSRRTAKPLAESFLEAIGDCTGCRQNGKPQRQRLVDRRLADIENYILRNLTDPDLRYDKVAAGCGISPRYLCYLLKANNTSFSDLLWKSRLPRARDWLVSPATRDRHINEIAFMSGFKSAAHFCRMFKATYGCSPREYRSVYGVSEKSGSPDIAQGGSSSLSCSEGAASAELVTV